MHKTLQGVVKHIKCTTTVQLPCKMINAKVNTLTPLASVFNNPTKTVSYGGDKTNSVGLFGITHLKTGDGFHNLKDDVLKTADRLVQKAISVSPSSEVIEVFDTLSDELCKVADLAEFVRLAHPDQCYADAAERTSFEIGGFVEKLNTQYDLYKALKDALKHGSPEMDNVTRTVAKLFLFDFEQSGIHLGGEKRKLAVELHEAVLVLGARFTQGAMLSRNYPVDLWPKDLKIPYAINKNSIIVDSPYSEAGNDQLREECYNAYMSPCEKQLNLLENLLSYRDQLASVLGFKSFSHRTLKGTMARNPETVMNFLEDTLSMLERPLADEINLISNYKKVEHSFDENKITPLDIKYYSGLINSKLYNLNLNQICEYFSVGACMEGLNIVFSSLYGVSLSVVEAGPGEVWEPDVQKVEVRHESEGVLGYIYCDFYQRTGKLPQDCHFTIRGIYILLTPIILYLFYIKIYIKMNVDLTKVLHISLMSATCFSYF